MDQFRPDLSWSQIGASFVKKGTSLVDKEMHLALEKAKAFALVIVGVAIGFLIFYVGGLLLLSERTNIPLSSVLLGGGFFLMALTILVAKAVPIRAETEAKAAERAALSPNP
jgi:hypothetical protein